MGLGTFQRLRRGGFLAYRKLNRKVLRLDSRTLTVVVSVLVFSVTLVIGFPLAQFFLAGSVAVRAPERDGALSRSAAQHEVRKELDRQGDGGVFPRREEKLDEVPKVAVEDGIQVERGKRAISLLLDDRSAVEGHASPGRRVDIVLTWVNPQGELKSEIIAENSRVLALEGGAEGQPRTASQRQRVTLEVAAEEVIELLNVSKYAIITLMLRSEVERFPRNVSAVTSEVLAPDSADVIDESDPRKGLPKFCPSGPKSKVAVGTLMYPPGFKPREVGPKALFNNCSGVRLP